MEKKEDCYYLDCKEIKKTKKEECEYCPCESCYDHVKRKEFVHFKYEKENYWISTNEWHDYFLSTDCFFKFKGMKI